MVSERKAAILAEMNAQMKRNVPHNRELGLVVSDFRHSTGEVWMRLPYATHLVGDPEGGVLHGGAITSLMDAACGMAAIVRVGSGEPIATLDLRIDYLKPATAGRDVIAHTECFKLTRHVAFVRGFAHHDAPDGTIARAERSAAERGVAIQNGGSGRVSPPEMIASVAATFMRKSAP